MLKITLGIALAALALLLIYAATRPDSFRVERSTRIAAPPEAVFPLINDLTRMKQWNPFDKKDPGLKGRYGDITSGPGASYAWDSEKVGVGSMTIMESVSPDRLTMQLDFVKPFAARNTAEYTLRRDGDATVVTWSMYGTSPFISKLMQVFFSLDRMIGKDFEDGLSNLKALAESR